MSVLSTAKHNDLANLLRLFPVKVLKGKWPEIKGTKEEICSTVARTRRPEEIVAFVDQHFSCCKQHIYVFSHDGCIKKLPSAGTANGERVVEEARKHEGSALFLYSAEFTAILTEPYEKATLKFLWPVRFDFTKDTAIVRLVVLEKNLSAHFHGREYVGAQKVVDDEDVLNWLLKGLDCAVSPVDLHKGIKHLWKENAIDCTRVRYKQAYSTDTTTMDEEQGIREKNPELYEVLLTTPLQKALFIVKSKDVSSASVFLSEPSNGYLAFPRYTEDEVGTDNVVRKILTHN